MVTPTLAELRAQAAQVEQHMQRLQQQQDEETRQDLVLTDALTDSVFDKTK